MKYIYVVQSGCFSKTSDSFLLTPSYFTSKSKAIKEVNEMLRINQAENCKDSFEDYPNLMKGYILATDYVGEGGKYKARVLIERVKIN